MRISQINVICKVEAYSLLTDRDRAIQEAKEEAKEILEDAGYNVLEVNYSGCWYVCSACKKDMNKDAKFCMYCGEPSERKKSEPTVPPKPLPIVYNGVRCSRCGQEIQSRYRHHFVTCECGDVAIDGGHDYLKRMAREGAEYIELSLFKDKGGKHVKGE